MSWSVSFKKPVTKAEAMSDMYRLLVKPEDPAMMDQFQAACDAAKELIKRVPGPFIMVSLNGHANGIGWQSKEGWSNDCIYVSVSQLTDKEMEHLKE